MVVEADSPMIDHAALMFTLQHFNPDIEAMDVNEIGNGLEIIYLNKAGELVGYLIGDVDEFEAAADELYIAVQAANKRFEDQKYLLLASIDIVLSRYKKPNKQ